MIKVSLSYTMLATTNHIHNIHNSSKKQQGIGHPAVLLCQFFVQLKKIKKDFPGLVEYIELETIFEWSIECVSADVYIE